MPQNIACDEIIVKVVYKEFLKENNSLYSFYFDNDDVKVIKE